MFSTAVQQEATAIFTETNDGLTVIWAQPDGRIVEGAIQGVTRVDDVVGTMIARQRGE